MKNKILETAVKYNITIDSKTLGKYQYYIARDFLGFGKIDGIMRDENIEDVSCDGVNSPVFVWHRKYESIPSNIFFETPQELENFVFKLAYLCGIHISIAQPILELERLTMVVELKLLMELRLHLKAAHLQSENSRKAHSPLQI